MSEKKILIVAGVVLLAAYILLHKMHLGAGGGQGGKKIYRDTPGFVGA